jgi:hypothetical protein
LVGILTFWRAAAACAALIAVACAGLRSTGLAGVSCGLLSVSDQPFDLGRSFSPCGLRVGAAEEQSVGAERDDGQKQKQSHGGHPPILQENGFLGGFVPKQGCAHQTTKVRQAGPPREPT